MAYDATLTASREDALEGEGWFETHDAMMTALAGWGVETVPRERTSGLTGLLEAHSDMEKKRARLPWSVDGIVYKASTSEDARCLM